MPNRIYLILGPDGNDELPMHWDHDFWQWVESGALADSTLYTEHEVFGFPPGQLPVGATCIMDLAAGIMYTSPMEGGQNKI
jgi:hypothetical protein